jgi:hypothetical protein
MQAFSSTLNAAAVGVSVGLVCSCYVVFMHYRCAIALGMQLVHVVQHTATTAVLQAYQDRSIQQTATTSRQLALNAVLVVHMYAMSMCGSGCIRKVNNKNMSTVLLRRRRRRRKERSVPLLLAMLPLHKRERERESLEEALHSHCCTHQLVDTTTSYNRLVNTAHSVSISAGMHTLR